MNGVVHHIAQRSPEWFALRVGLLTGSCANAVIKERTRGTGELEAKAKLRRRLICERLTGLSMEEPFTTPHLERGMDFEGMALNAYEARTGLAVQRVGFVKHSTLQTGCSPDGQVNEWEGVIELKVPKSTTHLEYLQAGVVPDDYRGQILHALWLTGAQWCDFCSFDSRFPQSLELFILRVPRNDIELCAYGRTIEKFLGEVDAEVEALKARELVSV